MSEEEDLSEWGEAMSQQSDAESAADDPWGAALNEQADSESINAAPDLDALSESRGDSKDKVDLDVLLDIPVTLQLEIGRTKVSIRNLLSYTQGSVVEMDRLAGEPLDLLVNGTLIAHGEVVVINDKFGVRLTDVISPQERIKKLK